MTDVTVLGGGIIGMTAAIRLPRRGAQVTVVCAADILETVSPVAAAVWYPTHTDPEPWVQRWVERAMPSFCTKPKPGYRKCCCDGPEC